MTQDIVRPLHEVADIVRSKNAGPFRITLDVLFEKRADYEAVRAGGAISRASVAAAYGLDETAVSSIFEIDMAQAFKVTLFRPLPQGAVGETDMYGCQQHVPLMNLPVRLKSPS